MRVRRRGLGGSPWVWAAAAVIPLGFLVVFFAWPVAGLIGKLCEIVTLTPVAPPLTSDQVDAMATDDLAAIGNTAIRGLSASAVGVPLTPVGVLPPLSPEPTAFDATGARVSLDGTLHTSARIAIDLGARLERIAAAQELAVDTFAKAAEQRLPLAHCSAENAGPSYGPQYFEANSLLSAIRYLFLNR